MMIARLCRTKFSHSSQLSSVVVRVIKRDQQMKDALMLRHLPSMRRASLAAALTLTTPAITIAQDAPVFQGSALLILSNTDMPASAFVDGKLVPGARDRLSALDTLTVLSLPVRPAGTPDAAVKIAELPVSNSVVGPPYAMAASPDKRTAYVLETRGPAPEGVETVPYVFAGLPAQRACDRRRSRTLPRQRSLRRLRSPITPTR
jgi:hypothetical protein